MNRPLRACLLVAISAVFAGCHRTEPPPDETPVAPVKAVHAEFATYGEWTELIGATQPLPGRLARITAAVEGEVHAVLTDEHGKQIHEGQTVEKDQVIVRLDDRSAKAQYDKGVAILSELVELRKQADLASQIASLDLESLLKLNPPGTLETSLPLVSKLAIEKARLTLQDAESKQRGVAAKEKSLRADVRSLEVHLKLHELRSPIKGVLGAIQVVPGQTLAIGAAVADVVDLASIDVVAFAPPRTATKLRLNQTAGLTKNKLAGHVVFIADQAQPDTGNIVVKVRFPNPTGLRANQIERVLVETQPATKRLTIPESALQEDQDPPIVVIAEDLHEKKHDDESFNEGKARKLRAILGIRDRAEHRVEIVRLEDPAKKDEVFDLDEVQFIIEGGHGLHDGDLVKFATTKPHE